MHYCLTNPHFLSQPAGVVDMVQSSMVLEELPLKAITSPFENVAMIVFSDVLYEPLEKVGD